MDNNRQVVGTLIVLGPNPHYLCSLLPLFVQPYLLKCQCKCHQIRLLTDYRSSPPNELDKPCPATYCGKLVYILSSITSYTYSSLKLSHVHVAKCFLISRMKRHNS